MNKDYRQVDNKSTLKKQWARNQVVNGVIDFEQAKQEKSQREFVKETGIPRSTLRHWVKRKSSLDSSPAVIHFFESPEGLAFLHRLITAALFIFTKAGIASIHNVSEFIKLCGLSPFIASSYTSQCRASGKMDDFIIEFGENEQQKLSKTMRPKQITLAEDETFHPQTCLVSMEPYSNYIIAEKYSENRKGETWTKLIHEAIADLPVEVIQITSDGGTGLLSHALNDFNAHHSPDCFHVPHDIGKGTSGALASKQKKTWKALNKSTQQVEKIVKKIHQHIGKPGHSKERYHQLETHLNEAVEQEQDDLIDYEQAQKNQKTVRVAKAGIGTIYHPFNLTTGEKQTPEKVSELLNHSFERINNAITDLSERCQERVAKAHRVVKKMTGTLTFFFNMVAVYLENSNFSMDEKELIQNILIPGYYLKSVAKKEKDKTKKADILEQSNQLLSDCHQNKDVFLGYSDDKIIEMKKSAQECVRFFQRSSSCVEGRNGQLSLRHHGLHRLSDRCLNAQTILHNFYRKNRDKETPAERFFEAKHEDLFDYLLERMDYPARPRKHNKDAA